MSYTSQKNRRTLNPSIFEKLESREMFSVWLPSSASILPPPSAAPAALIAAATKTAKVQAIVSTTGTGLTGEYFSDANFQTAYMLRTDATVKIVPAAKKDPATVVSNAIRWTGQISPSYSGSYSFTVIAKGGVRLWVNGQLIIDDAAATGGNYRSSVNIALVAGQKYAIKLEYTRRSTAGTSAQLIWSSLHQKQGLIPQKAMFPDATVTLPAVTTGLIGQYYLGKNYNTLVMQRVDPTINFNFGSKSPTPSIPNGSPFSVRWTGQIIPTYSETYTFKTTSDDGVRLYVDDQLIISDWNDHNAKVDSAAITLVAGQAYDIRMDYYEDKHVATAQLRWSSPSQPLEVVPASVLSSTPIATAGTLTTTVLDSDSIKLSWTGSASAAGYLVQQSTDGGATYATIAATAADELAYEVDNLDPATSYLFRITPKGSTDTSTPSNYAAAMTATPSPGNVSANTVSSTSTDVSWDDVAGNNGYVIYAAPASSSTTQSEGLNTRSLFAADTTNANYQPVGTVAADVTSFLATGLSPGTQYQFTVRSLNAAGTLSDLSNIATATTASSAPGAVANLVPTTNSIVINWADVAGETGFAVDRSLTGINGWNQIGSTTEGVTTYADTTVQAGTSYFYRVRALNNGGSSDPSQLIQAVTAVNAPTGLLSSAISSTGTLLSWADVTGEDGFVVLESADGGNTFSQIGITPAGVTIFPVTGLTAASPYQFKVESLNAAAQPSVASPASSLVTTTIAPVSLIAVAVSTTQANLTWTDVPGETGFILQRSPDGVAGWSTIATRPAATLSYTDNTLSAGTNYFYRVRATNSGGTSPASITATALTIPSAPIAALTGLSVAQSQVSWAAVTGATQYLVERSSNGLTNWTTAGTAIGSVLSAAVTNLTPSTVYYYRVTAINATGSSTPSTIVSQMSAPSAIYTADSTLYGATSTLATSLVAASSAVYSVNMTAGTSTLIGQLIPGGYAVQRNPADGDLFYAVGSTTNSPTLYIWDPTTGNNIPLGSPQFLAPLSRGAFDANGIGWSVDTAGHLYHQPVTGFAPVLAATLTLAGQTLASGKGNMVFSPSGALYLVNNGSIYTVNTTTGVLTPYLQMGINNVNIVFGQSGSLYATDSNGHIYNVTSTVATLLQTVTTPIFTSLTAMPIFADPSVAATANTNAFTAGTPTGYSINVTNGGPNAADGITVSVTLGTGATFTSLAGTGWTAIAGAVGSTGQTVILNYSGTISANGYAPTATLNVAIGSSAHVTVATTFTVSSDQFDGSLLNNTTVVTTPVI